MFNYTQYQAEVGDLAHLASGYDDGLMASVYLSVCQSVSWSGPAEHMRRDMVLSVPTVYFDLQ